MNEKEIAIRAELKAGATARDLSKKYDKPSYLTILKWSKEIKKEATLPPDVTEEAVQTVIELMPPSRLKDEVQELSDGLEGFNRLKESFQKTGLELSERIASMSKDDELTPAGMKTLAGAFNETVQAFNTASTIVNVLPGSNNNSNSDVAALARFKEAQK